MENNFRWLENPLLKFRKWFTKFFFVNHFPKTHASPPTPSVLSFTQHCKIFSRAFSGMQLNTRKKIFFPKIISIRKHFTMENILQRNKWSLREKLPWDVLHVPKKMQLSFIWKIMVYLQIWCSKIYTSGFP